MKRSLGAISALAALSVGSQTSEGAVDPGNQVYLAGGPHIQDSPLNAAASIIEEGLVRLDTTLNGSITIVPETLI